MPALKLYFFDCGVITTVLRFLLHCVQAKTGSEDHADDRRLLPVRYCRSHNNTGSRVGNCYRRRYQPIERIRRLCVGLYLCANLDLFWKFYESDRRQCISRDQWKRRASLVPVRRILKIARKERAMVDKAASNWLRSPSCWLIS